MRKLNKKGKPVGKAVLTGFTLDFGTPLDATAANDPANYQVETRSTRKVKKKLEHILHPISGFTVSYDAVDDAVTITLARPEKFPTGGQVTVLGGLTSASGGPLSGTDRLRDLQGRQEHRAGMSRRRNGSPSLLEFPGVWNRFESPPRDSRSGPAGPPSIGLDRLARTGRASAVSPDRGPRAPRSVRPDPPAGSGGGTRTLATLPARPGARDGRHPEPGPCARGLGPAVRRPPGRPVPAGSCRGGPAGRLPGRRKNELTPTSAPRSQCREAR